MRRFFLMVGLVGLTVLATPAAFAQKASTGETQNSKFSAEIMAQGETTSPTPTGSPSPPQPGTPEEEEFDPDAGVPIGMKAFPFIAGGLLLLLILGIGLGYIRNVQKTSESQ